MRYRLRTLLILMAVGPPVLGWFAWPAWLAYKEHQHRQEMGRLMLTVPRIITNAECDGVQLSLELPEN